MLARGSDQTITMGIEPELLSPTPRQIAPRGDKTLNPWSLSGDFGCMFSVSILVTIVGSVLAYFVGTNRSFLTILLSPLLFVGIVCLITSIILYILWGKQASRTIEQHKYLAQYGTAVLAQITIIREESDTSALYLFYKFTTDTGEEFRGEWNSSSYQFDSSALLYAKQNGTVTFLYDPQHPDLHLPYDTLMYSVTDSSSQQPSNVAGLSK